MNKKIYTISLIILTLIFGVALFSLINNAKTEKEYTIIAKEGSEPLTPLNNDNKYDEYKKAYNNNEIIGSLIIKGAGINTLFVQTDNNTYYLKHSIKKETSKLGAVFLDYRNNLDTSKQLNIYGHNSNKYNVPFHGLIKYLDNDFTKQNDLITIELPNKTLTYQIYNIKVTKSDEHINLDYINNIKWLNHLEKMRENSIYDTKTEITTNDQILVLQTCLLNNSGNYLVISAKRV